MKTKDLEGEFELEKLRHENKMKEIEAEFECRRKAETQKFDHMMQMHRLKRADISRSQMRKQWQ